jgi:hypothetical protein
LAVYFTKHRAMKTHWGAQVCAVSTILNPSTRYWGGGVHLCAPAALPPGEGPCALVGWRCVRLKVGANSVEKSKMSCHFR